MPRRVSRERCLGRMINPIDYLCPGKHIAKVRLIAGDRDMRARGDDGRNHQIGIALPPAMLPPKAFHHGRTGGVEHDDLELGEHLLRVQQSSVREGCFGWRGPRGKVTPSMEHFSDDH